MIRPILLLIGVFFFVVALSAVWADQINQYTGTITLESMAKGKVMGTIAYKVFKPPFKVAVSDGIRYDDLDFTQMTSLYQARKIFTTKEQFFALYYGKLREAMGDIYKDDAFFQQELVSRDQRNAETDDPVMCLSQLEIMVEGERYGVVKSVLRSEPERAGVNTLVFLNGRWYLSSAFTDQFGVELVSMYQNFDEEGFTKWLCEREGMGKKE